MILIIHPSEANPMPAGIEIGPDTPLWNRFADDTYAPLAEYEAFLRETYQKRSVLQRLLIHLVQLEAVGETTTFICPCDGPNCHGPILKFVIEDLASQLS